MNTECIVSATLGLSIGYVIATMVLANRNELGIPASRGLLSSPTAVMAWLGGPLGAAMWADVDPDDTKDWYEDIPTGWQMRLFLKARSEGYTITPGAFGLKSDGRPYWPLPAMINQMKANEADEYPEWQPPSVQ